MAVSSSAVLRIATVVALLVPLGGPVIAASPPVPSPSAPPVEDGLTCRPASEAPAPSASASLDPNDPVLPSPPPATGTAWSITLTGPLPGCRLDSVVSFGDGFAAVRGTTVLVSADGLSWPERGEPLPHAKRAVGPPTLVAFRGALYAFVARPGALLGWRRDDDGGWHDLDLPQLRPARGVFQETQGVAAVDGRLLVLGGVRTPRFNRSCENGGACSDTTFGWVTRDGRTWRVGHAANPDDTMFATRDGRPGMVDRLWPMGDRFAGLGPNGRIVTSEDGIHWVRAGLLPKSVSGGVELAYRPAENATYLLGQQHGPGEPGTASVLRSIDLTHWTTVYRVPWDRWTGSTIAATDAGIAIGGFSQGWFPWMALSPDGIDWDLSVGWPGNEHGGVDGMAIGPGLVVAIGAGAAGEGPIAWAHPPLPPA